MMRYPVLEFIKKEISMIFILFKNVKCLELLHGILIFMSRMTISL